MRYSCSSWKADVSLVFRKAQDLPLLYNFSNLKSTGTFPSSWSLMPWKANWRATFLFKDVDVNPVN